MSDTSLMYWQEKLGKTQPRVLRLEYEITAAKTVSPLVPGIPAITSFDAIAAQSTIDNFLGTTNEFLVTAFDATAMGNDTFAAIANMSGQVQRITKVVASCYSGTAGSTHVFRVVKSSAALTASTLATEAAVGANGNVAVKVDFGNTPDFDALTAGLIVLEIYWISK